MVSRMPASVNSITRRSMPRPMPPMGGAPYSRARRKSSSSCMASSSPAAAIADWAVVPTWATDFRDDVAKIAELDIPILIAHGTADNILPIDATGRPFSQLVPKARYVEVENAPHGFLATHGDEVAKLLVEFATA